MIQRPIKTAREPRTEGRMIFRLVLLEVVALSGEEEFDDFEGKEVAVGEVVDMVEVCDIEEERVDDDDDDEERLEVLENTTEEE